MSPNDHFSPKQSTESVPLAFRKYGEKGPHLVVLHGLFGSGNNWAGFARKFKNLLQLWTLDARNHGNSPHDSSMNYGEMAEDIVCFLKQNQLENIILLGHSMGGKTAMLLALKYPKLISGLMIADIAPVKYEHHESHRTLIQAMLNLSLTPETTREQVDQQLAKDIPTLKVRAFLMTNLKRYEGQLQWRIPLDLISNALPDLMDELHSNNTYTGPTLFVGGANSDYIVPKYHNRIKSFFPKSQIAMLKNCGHVLHEEQPEAFAKTVEIFLKHNSLT